MKEMKSKYNVKFERCLEQAFTEKFNSQSHNQNE